MSANTDHTTPEVLKSMFCCSFQFFDNAALMALCGKAKPSSMQIECSLNIVVWLIRLRWDCQVVTKIFSIYWSRKVTFSFYVNLVPD